MKGVGRQYEYVESVLCWLPHDLGIVSCMLAFLKCRFPLAGNDTGIRYYCASITDFADVIYYSVYEVYHCHPGKYLILELELEFRISGVLFVVMQICVPQGMVIIIKISKLNSSHTQNKMSG